MFNVLQRLLGIKEEQPQQQRQQRPMPNRDGGASRQPQTQVAPRPMPGYEQQAQAYESAMSRGDFNSPDVLGKDPAFFGYAPDGAAPKVAGRTPLPGYLDSARQYENAMQRGDLNSPDVIGQDPAFFGYGQQTNRKRMPQNRMSAGFGDFKLPRF